MDVQGVDLPISEPGEYAKFAASRKNAPPAPNGLTAETPPAPLDPQAKPAVAAEPAEPATPEAFEDPETHDTIDKPTRADKRIKRLWADKETEKAARLKAEQRAADLERQLAERVAAPSPASSPAASDPSAAPDQALTAAAQARIRPKPDRAAIGTTYPTYEDYVEDCAIWGGELAAAKGELRRETSSAQQADEQRQSVFTTECAAAKGEYADFDAVTTTDLPISQAIWDATVNAPAGLKGHVLYWLGSHPDEAARIAALPPGPALVEMGQVIATVKTARAGKPAAPPAPSPKPHSAAPPPPTPVTRTSPQPGDASRIAEQGGNPLDYMRQRNAEVRARGRL